ncbi:MAG TPA: hypothetical protein VFZ78_13245 [Flavisolibacter sp.]
MNKVKRLLGLLWMVLGPVTIAVLVGGAVQNIDLKGTSDISRPLPWIIIIAIFTPVAIGLTIFGWYAWKGEYDRQPE